MRPINVCILFLITICMPMLAAAANGAPKDPEITSLPELKRQIENTLVSNHIPAMGIVLISKGKVEWEGALGMADPVAQRAANIDTQFRIGSISKGLVALAALKLQQEGKLNLNDTFKKWAPEIALENRWEAAAPVRLVHLLEHTSGLNDLSIREYAHKEAQPLPIKAALDLYPAERATRWPPGSRFSYSNMGPALMAYVIEKASGQPFEDYIQQNFFIPIGMTTATYFHPDEKQFAGQYANDGRTRLPYWDILFRPSGAINASPRDMGEYLKFFLARGRAGAMQVLAPAAIERMERCETLPMCRQGVQAGYGLHSVAVMEHGLRFQGHDGAVGGALAFFAYLPRQQSGYVLMFNSAYPGAHYIRRLVSQYLARQLQASASAPAPPPAPGITPDKEDLARYDGYYRGISPRMEQTHGVEYLMNVVKLSLDENGMTSTAVAYGYAQRWVALRNRLFRRPDDPEATAALYLDAGGRPRFQSSAGTMEKVSALAAVGPLALAAACLVLIISAPVFAMVWGLRKLAGRPPAPGPLKLRMLPLLASLALVAAAVGHVTMVMAPDPIPLLGAPTPLSIAVFASGLAFAALSAAAAFTVWRQRRAVMHRAAYWHAALVTLACMTCAVYLLSWRLIGVPTWMT